MIPPVEPSAAARGLSTVYRSLFNALLEQQFTRSEALEILIAFIGSREDKTDEVE